MTVVPKGAPCIIKDCGLPVIARGWCSKHYTRWRTHGDPVFVEVIPTLCSACGLNERYISPKGQKTSKCKSCRNEERSEWGTKVGRRFQRYGLSPVMLENMIAEQNNSCAICQDSFDDVSDHVDHDNSCCSKEITRQRRSCGECVRDLLCGSCNQGLGNFKDDIERLQNAVAYLEKWKARSKEKE